MNSDKSAQQQLILQQLSVKLHTQSKIKRLREVPATFEALKQTVEAQIYDEETINQLPKVRDYHIRYIDGDQEWINVSDDDDLYSAYEVASKQLGGNIKFQISLKSKEEKPKKEKKDKKDKKEKKEKKVSTKKKETKKSKKADIEEEKAFASSQPHVDSDEQSESDEETKQKCLKNDPKSLPPRKAMKRLIQTELDKVAPLIFEELFKCKDLGQQYNATSASSESFLVQHTSVACDGCGASPIIGIRYKCIVCKNFDYCEVCEERIGHEHSFIKILRPENAPASIITGVTDNEPTCDQIPQEQPNHHFGRWGRGGRGGCRSGRGGMWRQYVPQFMEMVKGNPALSDLAQQFLSGMNQPAEGNEENKEESKTQCPWGGNWGANRAKWSEIRATWMNPLTEVIEVETGSTVDIPIEVQNQTKWPWKRGCFFGLEDRDSKSFIVSDIPIDFEVRGLQTFKLSIPVQVSEHIDTSKGDTFELALKFFGPKGSSFGQRFLLKFKVVEGANAKLKIYKAAITLTEAGIAGFEECMDALKKCNNDENAACQMLLDRAATKDLYE